MSLADHQPFAAPESLDELLANHAAISPVDARFRERAAGDPECLRRETFRELVGDHALLHYNRQAWPTFIGPSLHGEIQAASLSLSHMIRSLPERLLDNDPERVAACYGIDKNAAKLLIEPPNGIARALSRGDFILGPTGFKCIEFNMTSSLGGWETGILAEIVLRILPVARFIAEAGVKVSYHDTFRIVLLHLFEEARREGIAQREINTAISIEVGLLDDPGSVAASAGGVDPFLAQAYREALQEFDPEARGLLLACRGSELTEDASGALRVRGHRVHNLLEVHRMEARAFRAFKRGRLLLYNGPVYRILSDKRNIALLSESAHSSRFSAEEREVIARYIPWTRCVAPGETTFEGETARLEDVLGAERERLVLKRGHSAGGSHVVVGRNVTSEAWREALDGALRQPGSWVAQECVESLPFLFQDGEYGCSPHDVIWGPFVSGDTYSGTILRVQPRALQSIVNLTGGASEGVMLEVQEG